MHDRPLRLPSVGGVGVHDWLFSGSPSHRTAKEIQLSVTGELLRARECSVGFRISGARFETVSGSADSNLP